MKTKFWLLLLISLLIINACKPKENEKQFAVTPLILQNYVIKNFPNTGNEIDIVLFQNKEEFETILIPQVTTEENIVVPDFDLDYVIMITSSPSQRDVEIDVEEINKEGNSFFIKYDFQKGAKKNVFKRRSFSLFTLPKDNQMEKIVMLSPQNDSLSFSTYLQNMPPMQVGEVYKGVLPCADCKGIKVILAISNNFTEYELTQIYEGKIPIFVNRGILNTERGFGHDKNATVYTLDLSGSVEKYRYFVQFSNRQNALLMLSPEKEIIDSDLNYTLIKNN